MQVLPVYTPTAQEASDPALYAHNVRAAIATASGYTVHDFSNKDADLYWAGTYTNRWEEAAYALRYLVPVLETKEAMRIAKLPFKVAKLFQLAVAFYNIDQRRAGEFSLSGSSLL